MRAPEAADVPRDAVASARRGVDWMPTPLASGIRGMAFVRAAITGPTARRWYFGAIFSIAFAIGFLLIPAAVQIPAPAGPLVACAVGLFCALFIISVPLGIALPQRWQPVVGLVLFLLALAFLPVLGSGSVGLWIYVAVDAAVLIRHRRWALLAIVGIAALGYIVCLFDPLPDTPAWMLPLVIVGVGTLMMSMWQNIMTLRELRAAQDELARVAVEEERNRVGRDMHDILGHSLSAIAVKADLASALAEKDPSRAAAEIREVQSLARSTLSDMRAVVSGYRQVRVASELTSARELLRAAGLTAHLPTTTDEVPEGNRELFGWTLREAVTNIVRHADATAVWVTLTPTAITIDDDGRGLPASRADGNGLSGLAERVRDANGTLSLGRSPHGGLRIRVTAVPGGENI